MGDRRGAYRVMVGTPVGRRQLGRPRCRWECNIKMDLHDGWGDIEWIGLAHDIGTGDRHL